MFWLNSEIAVVVDNTSIRELDLWTAVISSDKMVVISEVVFFTAISVVTAILLKTWSGRKKSKLPNPPSIPSLPLVGSLPFMRNLDHLPKFFMMKSKELGPIFTFMMGNK